LTLVARRQQQGLSWPLAFASLVPFSRGLS